MCHSGSRRGGKAVSPLCTSGPHHAHAGCSIPGDGLIGPKQHDAQIIYTRGAEGSSLHSGR